MYSIYGILNFWKTNWNQRYTIIQSALENGFQFYLSHSIVNRLILVYIVNQIESRRFGFSYYCVAQY